MAETWGLLPLKEIPSIQTQTVWHAAALTRESFPYNNVLFIDWPDKPFVSVGFHQDPNEEIDLQYCQNQGYEYYRRACGGGQVFLDGEQIFYHMITDPENSKLAGGMKNFYSTLLEPVVKTYNDLGVNAEYAPINDIVANNKKVSGNGAATLGDSKILTGNFILSFPSKEMSKVLRVPNEKFRDKVAQSLEERVGSFESLTGSKPDSNELIQKFTDNFQSMLGVEFVEIELPNETKTKMETLANRYKEDEWKYEIGTRSSQLRSIKIKGDMFVSEGLTKTQGGILKTILVTDHNVINDITLYGDISVDPMDGLDLIAKSLVGTQVNATDLEAKIQDKLKEIELPGVMAEELANLIKQAAGTHAEAN